MILQYTCQKEQYIEENIHLHVLSPVNYRKKVTVGWPCFTIRMLCLSLEFKYYHRIIPFKVRQDNCDVMIQLIFLQVQIKCEIFR